MFNVRYEYRCLGIYQNNYVYAFYLLDYAVFIKTHIYIDNNNLEVFDLFSYLDNIKKYFNCKVYEIHPINFTDGSVFILLKVIFRELSIKINNNSYDKIYEIINSEGNIFLNLSKIIDSFINIFKQTIIYLINLMI